MGEYKRWSASLTRVEAALLKNLLVVHGSSVVNRQVLEM